MFTDPGSQIIILKRLGERLNCRLPIESMGIVIEEIDKLSDEIKQQIIESKWAARANKQSHRGI